MRSRLLAEAVALLAPPRCLGCGAPPRDPRAALCPGCAAAIPWLRGPRCPRCALPAPCAPCPARGGALAAAWAPVAHAGPARALVAALKFRGALAAAELMAAQMAATAPAALLADATAVPVPLPAARRRARGHDQAARLAAGLAARTGVPVARCLRRAGPPARQVGAGGRARRAPGRILVEVAGRPPPVALLVDDVHTTGATLQACARALRAAGAEQVCAVTYARALARARVEGPRASPASSGFAG
jgi:predicted amidophosphoribosyltransferase